MIAHRFVVEAADKRILVAELTAAIARVKGSASLSPGDRSALKPISEFGAKPYTEDEERSLSEIIKAFNERLRLDAPSSAESGSSTGY
jgi:hypothetical protein